MLGGQIARPNATNDSSSAMNKTRRRLSARPVPMPRAASSSVEAMCAPTSIDRRAV